MKDTSTLSTVWGYLKMAAPEYTNLQEMPEMLEIDNGADLEKLKYLSTGTNQV